MSSERVLWCVDHDQPWSVCRRQDDYGWRCTIVGRPMPSLADVPKPAFGRAVEEAKE